MKNFVIWCGSSSLKFWKSMVKQVEDIDREKSGLTERDLVNLRSKDPNHIKNGKNDN